MHHIDQTKARRLKKGAKERETDWCESPPGIGRESRGAASQKAWPPHDDDGGGDDYGWELGERGCVGGEDEEPTTHGMRCSSTASKQKKACSERGGAALRCGPSPETPRPGARGAT